MSISIGMVMAESFPAIFIISTGIAVAERKTGVNSIPSMANVANNLDIIMRNFIIISE